MHHRRRDLPSRCGPSGHEGQSGDRPVPAQGVYAHAKALRPRRAREALAMPCSSMLPSTRPQASALWINSFRGAMARLRVPLPTSRLPPHGDLRTARGRGGSLDLPRNGLAPYTPYRSPGKSGRDCSSVNRTPAMGRASCHSLVISEAHHTRKKAGESQLCSRVTL